MKRLLVLLLVFGLMFSNNSFTQKNKNQEAIGDIADGVVNLGIGILAIHQAIEIIEQSATEWVLSNWEYNDGDILEVKFFANEMKSSSDLSATRSLIFKVKRNNEPYKLLAFICSPNWFNNYGVVFSRVKPIIIDKTLWEDIIFQLLKSSTIQNFNNFRLINKDSIIANFNIGQPQPSSVLINLNNLKSIKESKVVFESEINGSNYRKTIEFKKIKGDQHIISKIKGTDLLIDFNEKRINLFNFQTKDLIKLNKLIVNDINRLFFKYSSVDGKVIEKEINSNFIKKIDLSEFSNKIPELLRIGSKVIFNVNDLEYCGLVGESTDTTIDTRVQLTQIYSKNITEDKWVFAKERQLVPISLLTQYKSN